MFETGTVAALSTEVAGFYLKKGVKSPDESSNEKAGSMIGSGETDLSSGDSATEKQSLDGGVNDAVPQTESQDDESQYTNNLSDSFTK